MRPGVKTGRYTDVGEPEREPSLSSYEDKFRAAGLVSFCRRPHLRPTTALLLLAAAVVAVEAVYYLRLPRGGTVLGLFLAAGAAGAAGVLLQHLEHRVDRPVARGLTEAGFILVPAMIAGIVGNTGDAFEVGLINGALLVAYVLEERLGARFILSWAFRFAVRNLRAGWRSMYRAVPLLTVVLLALFFASETWQVAAKSGWGTLGVIIALMGGGTMVLGGVSMGGFENVGPSDLRGTERVNIAALAAVATGVFSAMAAGAFALLLSVVGSFLIPRSIVEAWTGAEDAGIYIESPVAFGFGVFLVKTVVLIASIAAFVCSATLGSSETYRELSAEALREEIEGLLQERSRYLELLEDETGTGASGRVPAGRDPSP